MHTIYGIPNCDIIKKATKWFDENKISFNFHDYRKDGIDAATLKSWCGQAGLETIFNKRSTTWKELGETVQSTITDENAAIRLLTEHTSIIKRPVITKNGKVVAVGFDAKKYEQVIKA